MSDHCCLVQGMEQAIRVRDVKECYGLAQTEAEEVHPRVLVHSHSDAEKSAHTLRPERHADMATVFGPVHLGRHACDWRIGNGTLSCADNYPAIGEPVHRAHLPPLLVDKPAEDEVEAHQYERDAPKHRKGLLGRGDGHKLPENREPTLEKAERDQKGIRPGKANPGIRLANPQKRLTLTQEWQDPPSGIVHPRSVTHELWPEQGGHQWSSRPSGNRQGFVSALQPQLIPYPIEPAVLVLLLAAIRRARVRCGPICSGMRRTRSRCGRRLRRSRPKLSEVTARSPR